MKIFTFNNKPLRTLNLDNEPWFSGSDLAHILGYKKGRNAVHRHVAQKHRVYHWCNDNRGIPQKMTFISRDGAMELINKTKGNALAKSWFKTKVLFRCIKDINIQRKLDECDYYLSPKYTFKDLAEKVKVKPIVLSDFLITRHFMDERMHLVNKSVFIRDKHFTRIGLEYVKEMLAAEGFTK